MTCDGPGGQLFRVMASTVGSAHVGVLDPGLHDDRSDRVHDHDRVAALGRDVLDEGVTRALEQGGVRETSTVQGCSELTARG